MCGYELDGAGLGYEQVGCCGFGLDRAGSANVQVGCAVMDWIELAEGTDRWDVWL